MHQNIALTGIERHVSTPRSYAFPYPWRTHQLFGILYPAPSWKEVCGMLANLVADFGGNERQLSNLVEAICHDFGSMALAT